MNERLRKIFQKIQGEGVTLDPGAGEYSYNSQGTTIYNFFCDW